jgi:hypothetical protein
VAAGERRRPDPAGPRGHTIETDVGWAFLNVNGYLGTVTAEGDVVDEDRFVEDE